MNEVEAYMMQNRANLAQIWQMLSRNMALAQSGSTPFINSTYAMPLSYSAPSMFSQAQGVLANLAGDEAGGLMELLANPIIRGMLPDFLSNPLTSMLQSTPIGGTSDPGSYLFSQITAKQGRTIPQITLPVDFENRFSADLYNQQQLALREFAGDIEFNQISDEAFQPLLSLPEDTALNPNLTTSRAFQNVLRTRKQNRSFDNAFALFNELDIFGERLDAKFESSKPFDELLAATSEEDVSALFTKNADLKKIADAAINRGRLASGLLTGAQMLSSFTGGSLTQNAELQNLGDVLSDVLQLNENATSFYMQGSRALGAIGGLDMATIDDGRGGQRLISNQLIAGIGDEINSENTSYSSLRRAGLGKSAELLRELSRGGLLSTGGVDVFGNMTSEDVKRMEEAMLKQLEGFSEIAKVGKRMGLKTQEVIQNLQSAYGGRANEALGIAADAALDRINAIRSDGTREATTLVTAENTRRERAGLPQMGEDERREFLQLEAQRRGGLELMQQFEKVVESGRMAGIDTRGALATITTSSQILESLGLDPSGGINVAQEAFNLVNQSRNTAGTPLTTATGLATVSTKLQKAMENPNTRAYTTLLGAVSSNILRADDPEIQALLEKGSGGRLSLEEVYVSLEKAGVNPNTILTQEFAYRAAGQNVDKVLDAVDMDTTINATGRIQKLIDEQFTRGTNPDPTAMARIVAKAPTVKAFNLEEGATQDDVMYRLITMNQMERQEAIQQLDLSKQDTARLSAVMAAIDTLNIEGLRGPEGEKALTAQYAIEIQKRMYGGKTESELNSEARVAVKQIMADKASKSSGLETITSGFESVRDEKIRARAQELARADSTAYGGAVANEQAKQEAAQELANSPDFQKLPPANQQQEIDKLARQKAIENPRTYGILVPNQDAIDRATATVDAIIEETSNQITQQLIGVSFSTLSPEEQAILLESRGAVSASRATVRQPDESAKLEFSQAEQAADLEGVNPDEFIMDSFGDIGFDSERADMEAVVESTRTKLEKALVASGLPEKTAETKAAMANLSYADLLAEIDSSALSPGRKKDLRSELEYYRAQRIAEKQRGEVTRNALTNEQVSIEALDIQSADSFVETLEQQNNTPVTAAEAKQIGTELAEEQRTGLMTQQLITLQETLPALFTNPGFNDAALVRAQLDIKQEGLDIGEFLRALSGNTRTEIRESLPEQINVTSKQIDDLEANKDILTPAQQAILFKLQQQKKLLETSLDAVNDDPTIREQAIKNLQIEVQQAEDDKQAAREELDKKQKAEAEEKKKAATPPEQPKSESSVAVMDPALNSSSNATNTGLGTATTDKAPTEAPGASSPVAVSLDNEVKALLTQLKQAVEFMSAAVQSIQGLIMLKVGG